MSTNVTYVVCVAKSVNVPGEGLPLLLNRGMDAKLSLPQSGTLYVIGTVFE